MSAVVRYVALLRGINVGGNNIIKMADLRARFEELAFTDVATLIASGNVVFSTTLPKSQLTTTIEKALSASFVYDSKIVLVSAKDLERVIAEAPKNFGKQPAKYRYDVLFVKPPLTAKKALPDVPAKPGVDEVFAGKHALYFRRLIAKATQSKLAKIVGTPVYKNLTVRNWNTTTKLAALASKSA